MGGRHALHTIAQVAPWHPAPEMRALQVPVDPSGRDAIKPLQTPQPVEVRTEGHGDSRRRCVWADTGAKWPASTTGGPSICGGYPEPVTRSYYRVDPGDGRRMTLFHDGRNDRWYRQGAG